MSGPVQGIHVVPYVQTWMAGTSPAMTILVTVALHAEKRDRDGYLETGIANSAPWSVLSGQRCMIDFCLV
ncbi:MAG: hypothetical protein JWQ94_47 [Tardiphaga sp.]|jgi:hypothetical protein|nr:hypothetical protein [Tardiphaga sp.]